MPTARCVACECRPRSPAPHSPSRKCHPQIHPIAHDPLSALPREHRIHCDIIGSRDATREAQCRVNQVDPGQRAHTRAWRQVRHVPDANCPILLPASTLRSVAILLPRSTVQPGAKIVSPCSERVTPSGFEPEMREPKSLVLPLHHGVRTSANRIGGDCGTPSKRRQ